MGVSRSIWLAAGVLSALVSSVALANPSLVPFDAGKLTVSLPQGWKVTSDPDKGVIAAQEDPGRKDAAVVLVVVQTATSSTEDQLLDAIASGISRDLRVTRRETLPSGHGRMMIGDGTIDGVRARVGAIALAANGGAVVGVLGAKPGQFEQLGGVTLVATVLGSMRARAADAATAAPTPDTPDSPATGGAPPAIPITQPVKDTYGSLIVPPVNRRVQMAELTGEWRNDAGSVVRYVNSSTGNYAGFTSASTAEGWTMDGRGNVASAATYAVINGQNVRGGTEKKTGMAIVDANNVLTFQWKNSLNPVVHYIIRGWVELPGVSIMRLAGPYYEAGVPPEHIANPSLNAQMDKLWSRPRAAAH